MTTPAKQPQITASSSVTLNNTEETQENLMRNAFKNLFETEGKNYIKSLLYPEQLNLNYDIGINSEHRKNINEMDRVPDVVKLLREFSGKPEEFSSWRKSVERILDTYQDCLGTPKYYAILNVVRNKVIGEADIALEAYNTPLNWDCISRCLTLHFADKRDITTLEYQMNSLMQGNKSIQEYYQEVYTCLSLILNKIGCMNIEAAAMRLLTQTYRDKALDTFIRGLKGDLPRLLGIREPTDLPQALHLCLKLENQNYRTSHAIHAVKPHYFKNTIPPPLPPKRNSNNQFNSNIQTNRNFNNARVFQTQPNFNQRPKTFFRQNSNQFYRPNQNYFNNQNQFVRNEPKPEPMDVDESIQTRNVNYMNRPPIKRNYSHIQSKQVGSNQNKMQRNFHLKTYSNKSETNQSEEQNKKYENNVNVDFLG